LKTLSMLVCAFAGAALIWGSLDLPKWGDPYAPANVWISPYYLEHSLEDTATPNVVTSLLADYRGYDTLGETSVIFTSGVACLLLLRSKRKDHV
jgi:multicomponent Na+:H+ antiporter subunit B